MGSYAAINRYRLQKSYFIEPSIQPHVKTVDNNAKLFRKMRQHR